MKTLALDIWTDMREKRLWPVAIALLVGLVAVPVVLSKPAEEPPPADPVSAPGPPAGAATTTGQPLPAQLEAAKPLLQTSTLSDFESTKDPFKPLKALASVEDQAGVQTTEEAKPDTSGGDAGETGGGATGGSGGGGTEVPSGEQKEEEKTVFTYQAVVELATAGGTKRRVVNRLGLLPKSTNPLLVFLGVSAGNTGEAVFLVDSTVTQAGEGRCRPSAATCSFLYLTSQEGQDEHIFTTDDGKEYGIKLLSIRRVEVKESNAPQSTGKDPVAQVGSATTSVRTTDAVGVTDAAALGEPVEASVEETAVDTVEGSFPGFGFPLFADEVE